MLTSTLGKRARKALKSRRGQAAIELGLALPFLIWLIFYTINAFHAIHTAHVGQKFSAMNLYQRLQNRAKFAVDQYAGNYDGVLHGQDYMAVEYVNPGGGQPRRHIVTQSGAAVRIFTAVGICKELEGKCRPN